MLAKQRSNIDAYQHHQQSGCAHQHRQLLADDAEQSALKMGGIPKIQVPPVVLAVVLLKSKVPGQRVKLSRSRRTAHPGTKADHTLQTVVKKWIGRRIRGETAQAGERNPRRLRDSAEDSGKLSRRHADHRELMAID